jgi:hypothetical protein
LAPFLVEVNLRFYVRRDGPEGVPWGVVFMREVVPSRLVAAAARLIYHEPYLAMPTTGAVHVEAENGGSLAYTWTHRDAVHRIAGTVDGPAQPLAPGSEAEFITEHYWGYNTQRGGATLEFASTIPAGASGSAVTPATLRRPRGVRIYTAGRA